MKQIKYQKIIIAIAVLTFVFSAGVSATQANIATDDADIFSQDSKRAKLILESIEYGSYETWRRLVNPNSKLARKVSRSDFYEFVKARNLARQSRYQEALGIYEDLRNKLDLSDKEVDGIIFSLGVENI